MPHCISIIICCLFLFGAFESVTGVEYYSPRALAVSADETTLYVAEGGMERIAVFDITGSKVTSHISVPDEPTGFAPSPDGTRLYVTSMVHSLLFSRWTVLFNARFIDERKTRIAPGRTEQIDGVASIQHAS